ncbi:antiviral reverse transcriptase Drt3a [Clostridium formicaceticum]|uniref:Reverse transcriptase (RNA-dependent DNA polymerase) n=1 Tax=Clostridium formicaceticum TaxID=1497 RepID=A0AAC9RRS4_9CLOT|nr:antiviral reverse transcriptase Drt3a [Clostridium formicaceticum]AOY75324.1 hypothetical protein BJL90_05050 [Clostridium formicaceticum]ARE89770.1 Reverse transcriptase (RNA-dependent DNA polymerase) [Clostridium formicaceticum]
MNTRLDKDTLKNYFNYLKPKLKTGVDKVTLSNFERHLDDNLDVVCRKVANNSYEFSRLKQVNAGNRIVYIPTIRDQIVIEYLKDRIKKKYKLYIKDRNKIIKSLANLLSEEIDYFIIKLDINKFFSSVNTEELLKKIEKSSLLNSVEYHILYNLLKKTPSGLPEGLSISNYLSELYLESFDIKLKKVHSRVAFYSRYVDDIIIVINGRPSDREKENIKHLIEETFNSLNLKKNESKTKYIDYEINKNSKSFDYLGYKLQRTYDAKKNNLNIGISDNKLTKIFNKINYIFYEYYKDRNFEKLYERLLILTSKNKIQKTKTYIKKDFSVGYMLYSVTYGLPENYKYVNDNSFDKVTKFIKRKIYKLYPIVIKNNNRRMLYSVSVCNPNRVIIYSCIPFTNLRKKVYEISKPIPYSTILRMSKRELLEKYFKIVNLN